MNVYQKDCFAYCNVKFMQMFKSPHKKFHSCEMIKCMCVNYILTRYVFFCLFTIS